MRSASGSNREFGHGAGRRAGGDQVRTNRASEVPAPASVARLIRVVFTTLCLAVHGCDAVTGGAVELSWKLRPASSSLPDKFVGCNASPNPVAEIQLNWEVGGVPGSERWSCPNNHGVTGFDLAPGVAKLWVTPLCETGEPASADTYIAPALIQRTVGRGDTVSLGAIEIVVAATNCNPRVPNENAAVLADKCICDP